jgi:hypothetical protein
MTVFCISLERRIIMAGKKRSTTTETASSNGHATDDVALVKAWQEAANITEAATALGMEKKVLSVRAAFLRKKGVNLKKFKRSGSVDVDGLNSLIEA